MKQPASPESEQTRMRVDQLLVERGLYDTRSRARDAIARGAVFANGVPVGKAGALVKTDCDLVLSDKARSYVSRAALKLIAGLDAFGFDPSGRDALDIGASTGGFSQVLLERDAHHVFAVDVGHGQLHPMLADDPRLSNLEGVNARDLDAGHLAGHLADQVADMAIGAVVSDVSFISLRLALPPALALAAPGAFCVLLVKPQFEAGREAVGKGGIIRDARLCKAIAGELSIWLDGQPGWQVTGLVPSPIEGGDGNREFLLGGVKR